MHWKIKITKKDKNVQSQETFPELIKFLDIKIFFLIFTLMVNVCLVPCESKSERYQATSAYVLHLRTPWWESTVYRTSEIVCGNCRATAG